MDEQMDGFMDEWMNGHGWIDRWTGVYILWPPRKIPPPWIFKNSSPFFADNFGGHKGLY